MLLQTKSANDWEKIFKRYRTKKKDRSCVFTIALFRLNGQLKVFRIWAANGETWCSPEKFVNKLHNRNIVMGLMQLDLNKALNFSISVGGGCLQLVFDFWQSLHAIVFWLYNFNSSNSLRTASSDAHPRSQRSDFNAASSRFFDSNQTGDSGIYIRYMTYFSFIYGPANWEEYFTKFLQIKE